MRRVEQAVFRIIYSQQSTTDVPSLAFDQSPHHAQFQCLYKPLSSQKLEDCCWCPRSGFILGWAGLESMLAILSYEDVNFYAATRRMHALCSDPVTWTSSTILTFVGSSTVNTLHSWPIGARKSLSSTNSYLDLAENKLYTLMDG